MHRLLLGLLGAGMLAGMVARPPAAAQPSASFTAPIDRHALVTRHNPVVRAADPLSPLSLGNGTFAFTADVTGLQSFPEAYRPAPDEAPGRIPLATQAHWGWHRFPNPEGYTLYDNYEPYDTYGRPVLYPTRQGTPDGQWLRQNPHRLHLGQIGFDLYAADGTPLSLADLDAIEQSLDLWTGTLTSRFAIGGRPVRVQTWVHPAYDQVAVRVEAPGLDPGQIRLRIAFGYGSGAHYGEGAVWDQPDRHVTTVQVQEPGRVDWRRRLDDEVYAVRVLMPGDAVLEPAGPHRYVISFADLRRAEAVVAFAPEALPPVSPGVAETQEASRAHWARFWSTGGAVDLSGSTDPRAPELERRIVLSQYLTAIQCAGPLPPQETGLTFNSWYGKFHLEMHWWHGVHFALWGRLGLLDRSLDWYRTILPRAHQVAQMQGYEGARWPKMVGPDGREGPSGIGPLLVWQQPHPIYFAELVYRERPTRETLDRFRDVVFETADFMASFAVWEAAAQRYVLGPPLIPAQELHPPRTTMNPTFELAYWHYGLATAQRWRERLGLPRDPRWDHVLGHLAPLPTHGGLYVNAESAPQTFSERDHRRDHPTLLAACGMLPCDRADPAMMRRTLHAVMATWQWEETWGWDYPLTAMTAARVGEPEIAIDALLYGTVKNTYLPNGHNYQRPGLTIYLPGNGGLLAAVAMMAAGWEGAPDVHAPGFPQDGSWVVRWEGLRRMP